MKTRNKILFALLIVACAFVWVKIFKFFGAPVSSLPKYESDIGYISDGFQDYTIYHEYYFNTPKKVMKKLERNKYFNKVSQKDVLEIFEYLDNFNGWLSYTDFEDKCNFKQDCIDTSDYWYVYNRYAHKGEDHKMHDYDLYFFDVQSMTLYYIHNNI